jgi:hypothetical protein
MILFKQGLLYEIEQIKKMNNANVSVSASTVGASTTVSTNASAVMVTTKVSASANVSVATITATMVSRAKANDDYDDFDEYDNMTRKFASYRRNMYDEEEYYRDAGDYDHDSDWN